MDSVGDLLEACIPLYARTFVRAYTELTDAGLDEVDALDEARQVAMFVVALQDEPRRNDMLDLDTILA